MSLPSRERGLKYMMYHINIRKISVAPLAGAWIEIIRIMAGCHIFEVAPLAGAWIEIEISPSV